MASPSHSSHGAEGLPPRLKAVGSEGLSPERLNAESPNPRRLSISQCVTLACLLEATAPKPGNVHRGADFEDLAFTDFVVSATAIGPWIACAGAAGVGASVLAAVQATRALVGTNTNLGTVLLLAPLAAVPAEQPLSRGIGDVLANLNADDARQTYAAIRLAQPGGIGQVEEMDVHAAPPDDLLVAMRHAADRDLVARQYSHGFSDVLDLVVPWLVEARAEGSLTQAIIHVQMRLLAQFPDSLIARKCGASVAQQAAGMAAQVLEAGEPGSVEYLRALDDFDFWLRSDGHRRNPGTTADLLAAGLFVVLRDGLALPPYR